MLERTGCNLLIVGFQYDRAAWFNKHQLALIQGVGAVEIGIAFGGTKFGLEFTVT